MGDTGISCYYCGYDFTEFDFMSSPHQPPDCPNCNASTEHEYAH